VLFFDEISNLVDLWGATAPDPEGFKALQRFAEAHALCGKLARFLLFPSKNR
jgi:hypothetical protein